MAVKAIFAMLLMLTSLVVIPTPSEAASVPPRSFSDVPPCNQASGFAVPTPNSAPTPPRIMWPCPGWDPTRHGVAATKDITGDGVEEVAVGIEIPYQGGPGPGMVFLVDGATGKGLWYRRVDHAIWDLTYLPDRGTVIALSVVYVLSNKNWVSDVYSMNVNGGWLAWKSTVPQGFNIAYAHYGYSGLMTIDDVDGDEVRDILVGTYKGIVALSGTSGSTIWTQLDWKPKDPGPVRAVRVVGDIDGDGMKDIIASGGSDGGRCVFGVSGATGGLIWEGTGLEGDRCVVDAEDLDGDGQEEVVVATHAPSPPGKTWNGIGAYVLDGKTGAVRASREVLPFPPNSCSFPRTIIGSSDLNGDGTGDVVLTNSSGDMDCLGLCSGFVLALSGADLSELWRYLSRAAVSTVQLLDASGGASIVVGTSGGSNYEASEVYRLDANGQRLWTQEISGGKGSQGIRILGVPRLRDQSTVDLALGPDIDRNGVPDILAVSSNLRIYALSDSGERLWVFLP